MPPQKENKDYKQEEIRHYVELEAEDEKVTHVQWLRTEYAFGDRHDVWDVRTDKDRYWVISNPTNLYTQTDFVALDQAITYHFGLSVVLAARTRRKPVSAEEEAEAPSAWRGFEQASAELDRANEAEDFQAVGMRCRETLLAFVDEVLRDELPLVIEREPPKKADFTGWMDVIARSLAPGGSNERLRALLRAVAEETWQFVNAVTHKKDARRVHGEIAIEAVRSTMLLFTPLVARTRLAIPDECPHCESYRVTHRFDHETGKSSRLCEACGWEEDVDEPDESQEDE